MSPRLLYWLDDEIFIIGKNQTQQTTTGFLTITTYKIFELSSLGYRKFLVYYVLVVVFFIFCVVNGNKRKMENGNVLEMASEEAFNYQFGLWLLLSHIILSQTCFKLGNDSIEDREGFNPSQSSKSVAGPFSLQPTSSRTEWRHITMASCQNDSFQIRSFKTNFFRKLKLW